MISGRRAHATEAIDQRQLETGRKRIFETRSESV